MYPDGESGAVNAALVALVASAAVVGAWLWRAARELQRREDARGWEVARALAAEHDATLAAAVARERSLLAGEVHDRLGHALDLATVRLGLLGLDPGLAPQHRQAVGEVRRDLAGITDQVGSTVRLLTAGLPAPVRETDPVAVVGRAVAAGCVVTADLAALDEANRLARDALGRVLEETLANAARHAPAAPVTVGSHTEGGAVVMVVTNPLHDGPAARAPSEGAGTGLGRVRERVERVGGVLHVRRGAAFEVEARVPADAWLHPPDLDDRP